MKNFLLLTFFLPILICSCGNSEPQSTPGEWHELFNGKDLSGWKRLNGNAEFVVEEGFIVGTSKRNTTNTFLATDRIYGDFILEFEVLIDPFINSGVQFRSNSTDFQGGRVHGYQVEIDPSERQWSGGIYDESRRGWLYPMGLNPSGGQAFRSGEWNKFYVEAIGNEIKTWVNDIPAAYLIDDMTSDGFIALQVHSIDRPELVGRKIKWRNIRIKSGLLEPRDDKFGYIANFIPNRLAESQKAQGWISLFDGNGVESWRGAHQENFPDQGWKVENGTLRVMESGGGEAKHGGDIVTRDEFSAFEFQLEFKLTEGANSGIKYFVTEEYGNTEGSAIGLEYQLLDDATHPDAKMGQDGNRTLASLYDLITAEKPELFVRPPGEWNHARITVKKDNTVQHWLNHILVLEYKRGSQNFLNLVKQSKYKDWENFGMAAQGHLLLQDHGNEVHFRSIMVRNII